MPVVPALAALAILVSAWQFWPVELASAKPSVAVLPFDSLGGDEATGRLADGITEDIITDLARLRGFHVIARNSTAVYHGKPADVRQVGKDLNVRYVLEGSVQRQADQLRVTAQLIDAQPARMSGRRGGNSIAKIWGPRVIDFERNAHIMLDLTERPMLAMPSVQSSGIELLNKRLQFAHPVRRGVLPKSKSAS